MQKAEILLAGLGGQGVQSAGDILARTCTRAGLHVSLLPSYGAEARGTLIRSELVISDEEIVYPGVLEPDVFVAFSQQAYDYFLTTVTPETVIFYDSASVAPVAADPSPAKHHPIPAMEAASAAGNEKAANMVMLGAVAASSELIPMDGLKEMLSRGPKKRAETSASALEKGFDLASQQFDSR
jgi:2-oxoglutarate ferredoxin oxidoreductase subunit gamma